jgi:protein-L-isoaspartate(D-aspartate) O-methyltransferase
MRPWTGCRAREGSAAPVDTATPDFARAQLELVRKLRREGIRDERVLEAIARIPRELFVPPELRAQAYNDEPLPIAEGQTISQPQIVALMTEALDLRGGENVLEVGTGSGYQAAILGLLSRHVTTLERSPLLAERARTLLRSLGYTNIHVEITDGTQGWPERAPYDAIVVTAAAPSVPAPLVEQLREGGRLVLPVGSMYQQSLVLLRKRNGRVSRSYLGPVRFVPLVGQHGWSEQSVRRFREEFELT